MSDKVKEPEGSYPECEKMQKVKDQSQVCGEFLEWLQDEKKIHLCTYEEEHTLYNNDGEDEDLPAGYYGINESTERLLAEFFGIDLDKVEAEKRKILEDIRAVQK